MIGFAELSNSRDWRMADGATGANLVNMGLRSGECPELWHDTRPDDIRALYRGAVEAGSALFLTNPCGANRSRLRQHDAGRRAYELSKRAAEPGHEIADAAWRTMMGVTSPDLVDLVKMREAVDTRQIGLRPHLEAISAALCAFSSESDGTDPDLKSAQRERRARRRSAKAEAA